MTNRIQCVFSTDQNYCQHLSVSIASLIDNNPNAYVDLHIIHHEVDDASISALSNQVAPFINYNIRFYRFDPSEYTHFRLDGHITLASYFRLFLTDILPDDVDRVLFIDADTVVLGDISSLWNTPLCNKLLAAAPDIYMTDNARLSLPPDYVYFNAGVLLIDLSGWRKNGIRDTLINYVENNHAIIRYHDQDALNAVLYNDVQHLSIQWNFQARTTYHDVSTMGLSQAEFSSIRASPRIVHFTTSTKPWYYWPDIPFEDRYLHYLSKTNWRSYKQPDKTPYSVAKRNIRRSIEKYAPFIYSIKRRLQLRRLTAKVP